MLDFLKNNYDTLDGRSYLDVLVEGWERASLDVDFILSNISHFERYRFEDVLKYGYSKDYIIKGYFTINNLLAYHGLRQRWLNLTKHPENEFVYNASCALLKKGYFEDVVAEDINIPIFFGKKVKSYLKYFLKGSSFDNYVITNNLKALELIKIFYKEAYGFDENLKCNVQTTISSKNIENHPLVWAYEWHFDLCYPNLKSFISIDKVTPSHGPLCYIPMSNRLSSNMIALHISSALLSLDDVICNRISNYYMASELVNLHENLCKEITSQPIREFTSNTSSLIICDNLGIHRKSECLSGIGNKRTYIHPLPYPRASTLNKIL